MWDNNITWCLGWFELVEVSWTEDADVRSNGRQWPTVEQPQPRWGRSAAMVRRTWGQNNSLSPSPTYLSHTTNINSFENKVWEIYFYKEACSFVHWSSYIIGWLFPHVSVYLYTRNIVYNTPSSNVKNKLFAYKSYLPSRLGL